MTAEEIKLSLMHYFRFKRQWLCATECLNNDVMVITDKDVLEIEVKVNKYDLWKGEAKKTKHHYYKNFPTRMKYHANRFYICVTEELIEEAKKWVLATNNKYGIILCASNVSRGFNVSILKRATSLHDTVNDRLKESIMKRICSENIGLKEIILIENKNKNR